MRTVDEANSPAHMSTGTTRVALMNSGQGSARASSTSRKDYVAVTARKRKTQTTQDRQEARQALQRGRLRAVWAHPDIAAQQAERSDCGGRIAATVHNSHERPLQMDLPNAWRVATARGQQGGGAHRRVDALHLMPCLEELKTRRWVRLSAQRL